MVSGQESKAGRQGDLVLKADYLSGLTVKCYSGHTYAEEPRSFAWGGKEYEVLGIVKWWQEPGVKHFMVKTGASKTFHLCYNEINNRWLVNQVVRR